MSIDTPQQIPPAIEEARAELQSALRDPSRLRDVRVRLTISGGLPEERYELRFRAEGGKVDCALAQAQTGAKSQAESHELSERELVELFQRMDLVQLLKGDVPRPRIPPDSLVGRLELSVGREPVSLYFMADPGQARDAGFEPPPALAKAIDAIYGICGRTLGIEHLAP
jgi:hypothetical protein